MVARNKINIMDNKMRKRALVVVLSGSQFWLAQCTFVNNEAEDDSAIIYANQN